MLYEVITGVFRGQAIVGLALYELELLAQEDVGGIWAVSTHPQFAGRGVASRLLDEAHARMREAGLRFSTLGTNRYRVAYNLYRQHGYEDTNTCVITSYSIHYTKLYEFFIRQ